MPRPELPLLLLLTILTACAPAASVPAPSPAPSPEAVAAVADVLAAEDRRELPPALLSRLADHAEPYLRLRAARAAGRVGGPTASDVLLRLLADPDTAVAAEAAFGLGLLGDTTALDALIARTTPGAARTAPGVAAEAIAALGRLQSPRAAAAIVEVLRQGDPGVSGSAAAPVAEAMLAVWRHPRLEDRSPILRWTHAADPELRWRAVYALTRRPDPAGVERWIELATDRDPRVRMQVMRGLARSAVDSAGIGAGRALPLLTAATADADYRVRINAVRTLGGYPDPAAVEALGALVGAPERHLALAALESVQRLGPAASSLGRSLLAAARDAGRHEAVRASALDALLEVDAASARALALEWASGDAWRLRLAAGRVLARSGAGEPAFDRLVRDADARVAAGVLRARITAAGAAVEPLRPLLVERLAATDVQVRTAAAEALGRLADPSLLPLLLDAYAAAQDDAQPDAALALVDALAALRTASPGAGRAFFVRFGRSGDFRVRARVAQAFGDEAAWGEARPVETRFGASEYGALAAREVYAAVQPDRRSRVRIVTSEGSLVLELFDDLAPITVANLLGLAAQGYFDGQEWPRVVPNFVIQGGDPRGDMSGGPGYAIRDELNRYRYDGGVLGMALSGPDTGGSQFFVTHSPQPHLDGIYTVFGRLLEGREVAERLLPGDAIERVEIQNP